MPTESFSIEEFENALPHGEWVYIGYKEGERTYRVEVDPQVAIEVRSSIGHDGHAAETGADSIRMWLVQSRTGQPLGSKVDKWTNRTSGWQTRMLEKIQMLRERRRLAGDCPSCKRPRGMYTAKNGKNSGREFAHCFNCDNKYWTWFDDKPSTQLPLTGTSNTGSQTNKQTGKQELLVPISGNQVSVETDKQEREWRIANLLDTSLTDAERETVNRTYDEHKNDMVTGLSFLSSASALTLEPEDKPQAPKSFTPSPFQEAIRDFVIQSDKPLQIKAYAGSGKTSTNAWVCGFLPNHSLDVAMMVFSKANQLDMEKKIPSWIPATTTHSAGYADIRKAWGNQVKVDDRKIWGLLKETYTNNWDVRDNGPQIVKLISLCKNTLKEPNQDNLDYLCQRFNIIPNGDTDEVYEAVNTLYHKSIQNRNVIDFDDMLFLPASKRVSVAKHDLLFVDEYQDNNEAQKQYYLQTGARIIFVGDDHQSVYGFRGAMIGAMAEMQTILGAESLSLPISYRCAKSIIALAQTLVPEIQARSNAPDGLVKDVVGLATIRSGDMVLCRNNAPLVKPCFELIRNGIKANIKGRDLGTGLVSFVKKVEKKFRPSSFRELLTMMQAYVRDEQSKLIDLGKDSQAAKLEDDSETVIALSDGVYSVSELEARISKIFSDDTPGITFSTIHKAKGLESERVFVLNRELLQPQKYDKQDWQLEQLRNLTYVCYTRAKSELFFVV